jgi:hypothetical protein
MVTPTNPDVGKRTRPAHIQTLPSTNLRWVMERKRSGDARAMQNSQNIGADNTNQPGFGKRTGPGKRPSQVAILSGRRARVLVLTKWERNDRSSCRCCLSSEAKRSVAGSFPRIQGSALRKSRSCRCDARECLYSQNGRERGRTNDRSMRAASAVFHQKKQNGALRVPSHGFSLSPFREAPAVHALCCPTQRPAPTGDAPPSKVLESSVGHPASPAGRSLVGVRRCRRMRSPLLLRGGAVGHDAFDERAPLSSQRPQEPTTRIFRHDDAARCIADQETRGALFPDRMPHRMLLVFVRRCAADGRPPSLNKVCARLGGSQHASARVRPPGRTVDCACRAVPRQRSSHWRGSSGGTSCPTRGASSTRREQRAGLSWPNDTRVRYGGSRTTP